MTRLPRLALATPPDSREPAAACIAMLAGMTGAGWRVQHFRARARPLGEGVVDDVTGLPGRHLDSWLMPSETCREVFARGCKQADLALVEGTLFDHPRQRYCVTGDHPGRLSAIAEELDLPTIALVSCARADRFHLPDVPQRADAVLIDGLERAEEFPKLKHLIGLIAKRPVLGAVENLPGVRAALLQASTDISIDPEIVDRLRASFMRFADLNAIRALAESRPFPESACRAGGNGSCRGFRVAYAQDEAFGGYYPDTLEMLEILGADLVEFSPLRDETLPEAVDLIILGCGCPDRYAEELAANLSLISALKAHVCRGHRIYSEGGGAAYLGRYLVLGDRQYPGAGILPFDAILRPNPRGPRPVTRILSRDGWLGPQGYTVRGYRSGRWTLQPAPDPGDCPARSGTLTRQRDIYFRHHAIGSLVHLHLAALPQVIEAFVGPHRPSLAIPAPRF